MLQLGDFKRNEAIRDLMLLMMQRTGSRIDIQKLSRELGLSRPTLQEYISFLEGTYFIKIVRPFSKGKDSEIRRSGKVYVCDTGLANYFARLEMGRLFENAIFQNIRTRGELFYYQRKSGAEIDFILDKRQAWEVKMTPWQGDLRKLSALATDLNM